MPAFHEAVFRDPKCSRAVVNIGGIVSQIKKSKIKKGPNEGKLMAKFILDDQAGSVEVVVFSDLYAKYMKWLDSKQVLTVEPYLEPALRKHIEADLRGHIGKRAVRGQSEGVDQGCG